MCKTKAEGPYLRALQAATTEFSSLSQQARNAEAELRKCSEHDLAATIRRIQELERQKLQATVQLQALRKAEAFQIFPWQHDGAAIRSDWAPGQGVQLQFVRCSCWSFSAFGVRLNQEIIRNA